MTPAKIIKNSQVSQILLIKSGIFSYRFWPATLPSNILLKKIIRKEVIQPHFPVRLPCYDLAPVTRFTFSPDCSEISGTPSSHRLTGGVYKARERIHGSVADLPLLAIPASWSRIADSNPNCACFFAISSALRLSSAL
jgi:hypothetical protein